MDLLIKNAGIYDGSGKSVFEADLGIEGGRIAEIGKGLSAPCPVIDAMGLALAPGFIDAHSHADTTLWADTTIRSKIEQGVTMNISGMCGGSAAPVNGEMLRKNSSSAGESPNCLPVSLETHGSFGAFMRAAARVQTGSGIGFFIGHGTLREYVMGLDNREPAKEEMSRMIAHINEAMECGAFGVSFGLIYPPGCYAKFEEICEIVSAAAAYGGCFTVHMRDEAYRLEDAVEEVLRIAGKTRARCVISHHKAMLPANWGKTAKTLKRIDQAIEEGIDVYMDVYPYTAASTGLSQCIPQSRFTMGKTGLLEMMGETSGRKQLTGWILEQNGLMLAPGESSFDGFARCMIVGCQTYPDYEGMWLPDIANERGQDCFDTLFDLLLADRMGTRIAFFCMDESDLERVLLHPRTMICSDSGTKLTSEGNHPRCTGTFPRVLGRYVREKKVLTAEEAVRKMTLLPAQVYGLTDKGNIQVGKDADLVIFDRQKIIDHADYAHYDARNSGIETVILGGEVVVERGEFNGLLKGSACTTQKGGRK